MTRIDFYVLPEDGSGDGVALTLCKLCDKATQAGLKVYAYVQDEELASNLDDVLWTFRQGSFISHERYDGEALDEPLPMVLIGDVEPPDSHTGVLLNLAPEVPPFFTRFDRVLELVAGDSEARAQSRERFKFYRDHGYELKTHKL
ncbi:MAG TPA: DNA polymerase III subunit chi [Nevskiaceae bacterium]|nr:DNA polymerase III subunit chi [Nevskiaceae bacterium]